MTRVATVLALLSAAALSAAPPAQGSFERRVVSLTGGGGPGQRALFDITFETSQDGRINLVWIASANGLYSYDGYRWRRFGTKDGLPSDFVRCVLYARDGNLWVGTDRGAGIFDGSSFRTEGSEKGLAGPGVRRITQDKDGFLWFSSDAGPGGQSRGGITSYKQGKWRAWRAADGLPAEHVVNQFTDSAGRRFALTLKGPARLAGERWVPETTPPLPQGIDWVAATMAESPGFGILLSNGAQVLASGGAYWWALGNAPRHQHGLAVTREGRIVIAGNTAPARKAFFEWNGWAWNQVSDDFGVPDTYGEELREAPDGSVWYLGFDCLVRWARRGSEWMTIPPAPGVLFSDTSGGVWSLLNQVIYPNYRQLAQFQGGQWIFRALCHSYAAGRQGSVWAAADNRVLMWKGGTSRTWSTNDTGVASILNLAIDGAGIVWLIGRDVNGNTVLASYAGAAWEKRAAPELGKPAAVRAAASPRSGVWYALNEGARTQLAYVGGRTELFPVPPEALSKTAMEIKADAEGSLWMFGEAGLHRFRADRRWTQFRDLPARRIRSIGFQGRHVWLMMDSAAGGRSGLLQITPSGRQFIEADLTSEFSQSIDGTLAAGGRGRIFVIPPDATSPAEIRLPSAEPVLSTLRDPAGSYWALSAYTAARLQPDHIPPDTDLVLPPSGVLHSQPAVFTAEGRERFRPAGAGSDFTYSWQIDGGPWTPFTSSNTFRLEPARLSAGSHHIAVRARDSGLDVDPSPAETAFRVHALPLQERFWFRAGVVVSLLLLALAAGGAWAARRRFAEREAETGELRAIDSRLRFLLESAREGIASFDSEGLCTFANHEFARMFDKPVERIVGHPLEEFATAEAVATLSNLIRQRPPSPQTAAVAVKQPAGRIRHLSVSGRAHLDASGAFEGTMLSALDVTAQKETESAIRQSETYYKTLFESSVSPMMVVDLDTFRFLAANKAACEAYGYSQEEFQKITILDLQAPRNVPAARVRLAEKLGPATSWSWQHRRKDGKTIDVEITAQDIDFQGKRARLMSTVDGTALNRLVGALRESEAGLVRAQQIARIGSFQWPQSGVSAPCNWSAEAYRILGFERDPARLTATAFLDAVHPDDREGFVAARARAVETGKPVEFEHRFVRPDGTTKHLMLTLLLADAPRGKTLTGTIQDVSARSAAASAVMAR